MDVFIIELLQKYPSAVSVFVMIGVLRSVFKPLQLVIEKYVEATPDKADDSKWAAFTQGKLFKVLAWFVDYTASIKIPK